MITIRAAQKSDAHNLHEFGRGIKEFQVNSDTVNFWPESILHDAVQSEDAVVLIACDDDQTVGFLIANCNKSLRKAIIENIYVSPESRNQGVGRELLEQLIATLESTGYEYVATLVPQNAEGAASLYIDAGFSEGELFRWLDKAISTRFIRLK